MTRSRELRELLGRKDMLIAPGAHDAFSAKLVEAAGFSAVYSTGNGAAASMLGVPDIGLLTMTEMAQHAGQLARAVSIPVVADADTGYGSPLNVVRTVQEYERAGVAAVQLEDQPFATKRCGFMTGHQLVPLEEMVARLRAASYARVDSDLVVIARTDAISAVGFDEAIRRANLYSEAGADMIFVEAPRERRELEDIPKLVRGPVMVNVVGRRMPVLATREYAALGYRMAIYPLLSLRACHAAVGDMLRQLKEDGAVRDAQGDGAVFDDIVRLLGLEDYRRLEKTLAEALEGSEAGV